MAQRLRAQKLGSSLKECPFGTPQSLSCFVSYHRLSLRSLSFSALARSALSKLLLFHITAAPVTSSGCVYLLR